jgi:hypothetical protein
MTSKSLRVLSGVLATAGLMAIGSLAISFLGDYGKQTIQASILNALLIIGGAYGVYLFAFYSISGKFPFNSSKMD